MIVAKTLSTGSGNSLAIAKALSNESAANFGCETLENRPAISNSEKALRDGVVIVFAVVTLFSKIFVAWSRRCNSKYLPAISV